MDELSNTAPQLSGIKKEKTFVVPDGYFNDFPSKLLDKIHKEEQIPFRNKILISIRPKLYLAAVITGIILITYIGIKIISPVSNGYYYSVDQITEIIESNPYDYLFLDALEDTIPEEINDDLYTDEIINFLLEENIDYETIINEL